MVRRSLLSEKNDGKEKSKDIMSTTVLVNPSAGIHSDLDPDNENLLNHNNNTEMESLSIDQRYGLERQTAKVRHWRDNPYAAGLVEVTWTDELTRNSHHDEDETNGPNRECCSDAASESIDPTCGCLIASGYVCSKIGAGRVGNMAILKERIVLEEGEKGAQIRKRKIDLIVGPYWPMMLCITYPLILGFSLYTGVSAIPRASMIVTFIWLLCTAALCFSLFSVACRDPGILSRFDKPPTEEEILKLGYGAKKLIRGSNASQDWRWNDQAQTYSPRAASYDPDCAVVIEEFDHTCPWTGTAIGKKNMPAFQAFMAFLFICLIMDILLLSGALR
eukprot:CAMPEP_0197835250 /NCGR_PEP_ID=MMETSP1437-20131217/25202_1 /TAXON_ID=49252 ORGANISM="Eucampia antarctica, Strain CCMP1452" /NCGR_SAMPLE_ID=MMETSP1437 /ASSEMBLY_ACC=CAM_ASM_001096 /LENGTH=332 /DNA_ID=CAMNT_0043440529 /DNA_START=27 /DNA_END=1025 /DNA_ORIENTATION=+